MIEVGQVRTGRAKSTWLGRKFIVKAIGIESTGWHWIYAVLDNGEQRVFSENWVSRWTDEC